VLRWTTWLARRRLAGTSQSSCRNRIASHKGSAIIFDRQRMDREDRHRLPAARRRFGGERGSGRSTAKDDERRNRRLRSLPGRSGRYRPRPFRAAAPGMSTQPGSGRHRPRPAHRATPQRGIGRFAGATCRRQRAGGTLMRIRKLGLRPYGKFTETRSSISESAPPAPRTCTSSTDPTRPVNPPLCRRAWICSTASTIKAGSIFCTLSL
jgi:hypothetical protein